MRNQVQAFDKNVQYSERLTPEQFLEHLAVSDNLFHSVSPQDRSIEKFCSLANKVALFIYEKYFPNDDLLEFKDTGNNIHGGHVTDTKCRPHITAAFKKDWIKNLETHWALIRLAGEKASTSESRDTQEKHAASYLHYLLLARPDLLVAQGLLTTTKEVIFFVGTAGVGIQRIEVKWEDKNLDKLIYAFIYRLYKPSDFADPYCTRTGFNEEASEATYTLNVKTMECPGFRLIHARNPFATRTHVFSNPSLLQEEDRTPTVFKEQLCRIERRFDESTILSRIHRPKTVPGVVEAVYSEIIAAVPGRMRHRLGLRQTGSPFASIPTARKVLETLFDLLEVLRFLCTKRGILHRDISAGNVMYVENPEPIPAGKVEQLIFVKYLLKESEVSYETSLLLVDFDLGEDMQDEFHIERTGTPGFISRAVERGNTVPLNRPCIVPEVPKSPECYASAHSDRIKAFPEEDEELINPRTLKNQPQDDGWRHELDHDVESVFWLLLYWAMVAQPKGSQKELISLSIWLHLLGDFADRDSLVRCLSAGDPPENLTHSVYKPLWPLISKLAAILVVDRHWLPKSSRKHEGYICEAFQRLILQFIVSNRDKDFMTRHVSDSLRQVPGIAESCALATTPSSLRDSLERGNEVKRRRLEETEAITI